ncbi:hypothetical protein GFL88_25935 [Rhizobium leguminosarum bv. viciae]|nr:hypothetical protein [Rhizobium leguminosarum bv. viciae]
MSRKTVPRFCDHDMRNTKVLKRGPIESERSRHALVCHTPAKAAFPAFLASAEKPFDIAELQFDIGRPAVIALAGAGRHFHFPE